MDFKILYQDNSQSTFAKILNYSTRVLYSLIIFLVAPGAIGVAIAIAYLVVIHPIAWHLADKFRAYTQPEVFLSSGAMDTFGKRVFWIVGPQFFTTLITTISILFLFIFFLAQSVEADKVANTPPMQLPVEAETGYQIFDVNKNTGWNSDALLSAASRNPVILTGGIPFVYSTFNISLIDSPDKNVQKISFKEDFHQAYATPACIEEISRKNVTISEKINALPVHDYCSNSECTTLLDLTSNFHQSCGNKLATLPPNEIGERCAVRINGEKQNVSIAIGTKDLGDNCIEAVQDYVFTYNNNSGMRRDSGLESLRKSKIKSSAKPVE